jgi:hypothetical protein
MLTDPIYEQRLVLYADILGWCAATENSDAEALLSVLKDLHLPASAHNEAHRADLRRREAGGELRVNPMFLEVQFAVFSDNFVFSLPASFGARILTIAAPLVIGLLRRGFLVRGGITLGDLHHRDNVVFGPAMNEAVQIEQREAVYPRILVSQGAAAHLRASPSDPRDRSMIADQTGRLVANPFAVGFDGPDEIVAAAWRDHFRPSEIDAAIERETTALEGQGRASQAEKWTYMRRFIEGPALDATPRLRFAWGR